MTTRRKPTIEQDVGVRQILEALEPYQREHRRAKIDCRRRARFIVRIRIIDPDFEGVGRIEREERVWPLLQALQDETISDITMLLLLTPKEAKTSFANLEFDDPLPTQL